LVLVWLGVKEERGDLEPESLRGFTGVLPAERDRHCLLGFPVGYGGFGRAGSGVPKVLL
jgi:hypothetical protein